jgi:hypothetical protein
MLPNLVKGSFYSQIYIYIKVVVVARAITCGEKRKALLRAEFGAGKTVDKLRKTVDIFHHIFHPSLSTL